MKKDKLIIIIFIFITLIISIKVFVYIKLNKVINDEMGDITYNKFLNKNSSLTLFSFQSIKRLSDNIDQSSKYKIMLETKENIVYTNLIRAYIDIDNTIDMQKIKIEINEKEQKNDLNSYNINLNEGKNHIKIVIIYGEEIIKVFEKDMYYIKSYVHQFADEIEKVGVNVHYISSIRDDFSKADNMLEALGIKYIRTNFWYKDLMKNGVLNSKLIDKWFYDISSKNVKILALLDYYDGKNNIIDTDEKKDEFIDYYLLLSNNYDINDFEIFNEANTKNSTYYGYLDSKSISNYGDLLNRINKLKIKKNNIYTTGTSTSVAETNKRISSEEFYKELLKINQNQVNFSIHPYNHNSLKELRNKLYTHIKLFNENGGFLKLNVTEYGVTIYNRTEEQQAEDLVKQSNILKEKCNLMIIYNFKTTGLDDSFEQFGIVRRDFSPRPSYYAMKNYYENTNGAEYIGTVNIANGLESHVYDKDGKPVIITWSEDNTNNIQIDYKNFTAKDLYGKDIQPDENGKLTITASPVYLYDVDYNYFYKAISNVATSKYDEFKEKFTTEISQISGLGEKINQRQNYSQSVANTQKLMQNTAITAMKSHYELGDIILKAYEEGQLKAEPVKISSMLDMINDIGNSYEDLVTVSVNNTINSVMKTLDEANVDLSELTTTKQKIDETENLINTNTDVEIIYPTKILQFSKDCYEKADYINSLEEQNDIKVGLIISNNLHAQLLADWANKFASIQINNNINKYIAQNPVTIEYSETNITNKSVKATIKTNAEIQITNNSNSKEYVFEQNGSFTFEYTIKGQAKQITAKVTNIDKTSPTINGVIDRKLYTSKITPTITDENLDTIKLILNGEEVKNFKSGTTLTDEGFYTLTATDKAGNKTQISFQIMENNNQNYIIQDNIIKNISEQTIKSDFDNKLKLGITYKIARNEKEISNTDSIATGDILTTSAGDKYTIIVTGDMNKDGKLNLKDLVKMRKYLLDGNNLDENEMLSADCNFDGKINLKDLVKMRLMLLNQDATK